MATNEYYFFSFLRLCEKRKRDFSMLHPFFAIVYKEMMMENLETVDSRRSSHDETK